MKCCFCWCRSRTAQQRVEREFYSSWIDAIINGKETFFVSAIILRRNKNVIRDVFGWNEGALQRQVYLSSALKLLRQEELQLKTQKFHFQIANLFYFFCAVRPAIYKHKTATSFITNCTCFKNTSSERCLTGCNKNDVTGCDWWRVKTLLVLKWNLSSDNWEANFTLQATLKHRHNLWTFQEQKRNKNYFIAKRHRASRTRAAAVFI